MYEISSMFLDKVITPIEANVKDWDSISVDRYYEDINVDVEVAVGILDISRDIPNTFLAKRTYDKTFFYVNRM